MKKLDLTPTMLDRLSCQNPTRIGDLRTPGLTIEVSAAGVKTWRYRRRVRVSREPVKRTLGTYPVHSIQDARDWANNLNREVEHGRVPASSLLRATSGTLRLDEAHRIYMDALSSGKWIVLRERTLKDKRDIYRLDVSPRLGDRTLQSISEDDLWGLVETKGETAPVRANRLAVELRAMFAWFATRTAKAHGITQTSNPAATLETRYFHERPRDRWLNDDELSAYLKAVDQLKQRDRKRGLLLMLLTGARPSEVVNAETHELGQDGVWTIPATRTKSNRLHRIELGPVGRQLFSSGAHERWVIPSSRIGGPLRYGWAKVNRTIDTNLH